MWMILVGRSGLRAAALAFAALAGGCAWLSPRPDTLAPPRDLPLVFRADQMSRWEPVLIPGKLRTAFSVERQQGRASLQARSEGSASMLRQRLQI
ncbi:MAG: hypothetical protein ACKODU_01005, partial [Limnohabitans sp.]